MKITIKKLKRKIVKVLKKLNPEYAYWQDAKEWYQDRTGKSLDYNNPQNINEKLMWLTRYWQHPLVSQCADKYRVREYVEGCGLGNILIPLYGVWDDANDIDFDRLPEQFVLKCNHGCGYNIICKDKSSLDRKMAVEKLNGWMKEDFGKLFYEHHYSLIRPKIICEKYLTSFAKSVVDYKIHCINGEPQFILVCSDRDVTRGTLSLATYSLEWNRLNYLKNESVIEIPRPMHVDKMVSYAKILSKPFPHVRVDLYESDGCVILGEMTFTPQGNVMDYYKDEVIEKMGNLLVLPKKNRW